MLEVKKILVTGGAGFIGSHIVDILATDGYEIAVVDKARPRYPNSKAAYYLLDINSEELRDVFSSFNADCVIHLAAQTSVSVSMKNPSGDAMDNILGTINLLNACQKCSVKKIIAASTAAVYGDPQYLPIDEKHPFCALSPYALSKKTMEEYIKLSGLDYILFRCSNVYGPRQDPYGEAGVISIFLERILSGRKLQIYGDGEQVRDFIFVGDIAAAFLAGVKSDIGREAINLSCNKATTVNELYGLLKEIAGYPLSPEYLPAKEGDIRTSILDNSKLVKMIGFIPQTLLADGLKKTFDFFKEVSL